MITIIAVTRKTINSPNHLPDSYFNQFLTNSTLKVWICQRLTYYTSESYIEFRYVILQRSIQSANICITKGFLYNEFKVKHENSTFTTFSSKTFNRYMWMRRSIYRKANQKIQ